MSHPTLLFHRVDERTVDDVLQQLSDSGCLPRMVVVSGTNMQLLGALVACWKAQTELIAVLLPFTTEEVFDALDLILENEKVDKGSLIWVDGADGTGQAPKEVGRLLLANHQDASSISDAVKAFAAAAAAGDTTAKR